MVDVRNFYDATDEPLEEFQPLPVGEYLAAIEDSVFKDTKNGQGKYLHLTWVIVSGEFKGRKIFSRLNLKNPNTQAVQIARREFASIREATGILEPTDSQQLHGIPCQITVACEKSDWNGQERINNVIKKYARRGVAPIAEQQNISAAADGPQPTINTKAADWNP